MIEIFNNDNAVRIALQQPNETFVFQCDWNGEDYKHKYRFNKESLKFEEI